MLSSKAFRTAGLVALCLMIGVVLSGALGGAQVGIPIPPPPEIWLPRDPGFKELADHMKKYCDECARQECPRPGCGEVCCAPPVDVPGQRIMTTVKECGTTIAEIFMNTEPKVAAARSYDDGPMTIGAARSLDDGSYLWGKGKEAPLPKGDYHIWMTNLRRLPPPPPELMAKIPFEPDDGFTALVTISPDGKVDLRAILYYKDKVFRTPEEWLRIIGSIISLKDRGCDLTVHSLSVRYTKITPPCLKKPCPPPWWEIDAIAIIANIGQIDVKEPFTVRFLLNYIPFKDLLLAELAAGAQKTVLAEATVYTPGVYIVTVIVDPENRIRERIEKNNGASSIIILR